MKIAHLLFLLSATTLPIAPRMAAEDATIVATDPWDQIKNFTYEKRVEFAAGTGRLLEKLDGQIRQLNEKRATLPETSVKDWDFAMKELAASRSYLKAMIDGLGDATFETWTEAKDKVGRAWQRTQEAYDKVKASTTA